MSEHNEVVMEMGSMTTPPIAVDSDLHNAATDYLDRGLSIIPLNGKIPAYSWSNYQKTPATKEDCREWFQNAKHNIGIVTGELSGIAIIDFDTEEAFQQAKDRGLPHAPLVKTGRGYHLYCKYKPGIRNFQKRADLPGIDLRAEGGQAVAPPSMHQNGQQYRWVVSLDEASLPDIPEWLLAKSDKEKQPVKELYRGTTEGGRNNALARLVGSWINDGGTLEEILEQASVWNQQNNPPLPPEEVEQVVQSIYIRHNQQPDVPNLITDIRIAEYFTKNYSSKVRNWMEAKKWLIYDGQRWTTDAPGGPFPLFKENLDQLYDNVRKITDDNARQRMLKGVVSLESHKRQETVLKAAAVVPEMNVSSSQLDQDPMLLNCRNGTLNLKDGSLYEHTPEDFITRLVNINYSPTAECPEFIRFLDRIMGGNTALINYIQRYVGYCLTGNICEQILVFFYGTGANGKTTLANVIEMLLGDFASTAGSTLLMHRDNNSASNDLAALRGSRLVKVSEFDDGERLAEATVKTLTGGDRISCRFLYGEFFEYTPQYKILLLGNYKPKVRGRDHGIWRRIHLVPFNVTIPEKERDPKLMDKLTAELPGILNWAVQGCLKWQETGLCPPREVREEVEAYRHSEDIFQQWIDECCKTGSAYRSAANDLLQSFISYSNWRNISAQKFGRLLAECGFEREKSGTIFWNGIAIDDDSGQCGRLDDFSVKSREEDYIEKFTENGPKRPERPNAHNNVDILTLTEEDFDNEEAV
ncbi:putative DNA primase/helicase [Malonomonas rubra DSM 5091]|uniref:Putative DNA primase/helicase n=1 Tax=Malonomonas rubra DSM 5091 TaxID=1122189 RepID=A0A1M6L8F2_MALRU|nr:phage/plasmid primase, P4 family [Malonomonas rubra]SHJ67465.1 putative DNA primase/helicase [Malonomonas rubra DSM 5091]